MLSHFLFEYYFVINFRFMDILVSPNLLEEDLRNVVQPVQENGTGRRDLDPPAVGSASTTHGPMPPAPPTQSTKLRRSEAGT